MNRKTIKDLRPQDLVVCNAFPDATVWRVLSIDGFEVTIVDALLQSQQPNIEPKYIDITIIQRPTTLQIDRFRNAPRVRDGGNERSPLIDRQRR